MCAHVSIYIYIYIYVHIFFRRSLARASSPPIIPPFFHHRVRHRSAQAHGGHKNYYRRDIRSLYARQKRPRADAQYDTAQRSEQHTRETRGIPLLDDVRWPPRFNHGSSRFRAASVEINSSCFTRVCEKKAERERQKRLTTILTG